MPRILFTFLLAIAAIVLGAAFVWPTAAALYEVFHADWSLGALGTRRLGLLWRGIWVAFSASLLAQALGAGLAAGFVAAGAGWRRFLVWGAATVLLIPPYLYAYAWSLPLLPQGISVASSQSTPWPVWVVAEGRAIWCLACWSAPIAGALLSRGWLISGRTAYTLALQDAKPWKALISGGLPVMLPWIGLGTACTLTICLTEYTVCHLCLVQTLNTEVLAEAQVAARFGQATLLGWPLLVVVGLLGLAAAVLIRTRLSSFWTTMGEGFESDLGEPPHSMKCEAAGSIVLCILLFPLAIFTAWFGDWVALIRVWELFGNQWPGALASAALAGVLAVILALAVDALRVARVFPSAQAGNRGAPVPGLVLSAAVLIFVGAVLPPALIGDALKGAYINSGWVSNSILIVVLTTCARFAAIAVALQSIAGRAVSVELPAAAALDGANRASYFFFVHLPITARATLLAGLMVSVLSLTESSASALIRPAGVGNVAVTLLNQIHFGRNADTIALAFYLIAGIGLGIASWIWLSRFRLQH